MTVPFARYALMTFGDDDFRYWQAHYALLGLLAWAPKPCEIVMATDHPERFRWFGDAVRIHAMSKEQLQGWIGPSGYFLRTLIETARLAGSLGPCDVAVYTDTDTVARGDLTPMISRAAAGTVLMDRFEYVPAKRNRKGTKALWAATGNRTWAGLPIGEDTPMWNTGVTAVSRNHLPRLDQALTATDAILASGCRHYLTEQIAMSAALAGDGKAQEVNPLGQDPLILHYWGNKDAWNGAITGQLATIQHRSMTVADAAAYLREHPIHLPPVVKLRWWHRALGVQPIG